MLNQLLMHANGKTVFNSLIFRYSVLIIIYLPFGVMYCT